MILLAGGTGRLGTILTARLLRRGLQVRVLTRDSERAGRLFSDRVTVVAGDVRDPESLGRALSGVDLAVSAVQGFTGAPPNSPATVDRDGNANLIDAAEAAGAEVVLLSTVGARPDSPIELFRMKDAAERHAAGSGAPTTIVRATAFLELWIDLLTQTSSRSGRPLIFGRGQNPINFVSVEDVAALVERAVTDSATRGATLEIGGPENLTLEQLAQAVQEAAGRSRAPRHLPRPLLRLVANTIGRAKPALGRQARTALAMDRADLTFDATPIHHLYPDLPWTSVTEVLARPVLSHAE